MSVFDTVDGSSTGIAMRQIAVVIQEQRMTANGTKQTLCAPLSMSAFGGKADIEFTSQNVCFGCPKRTFPGSLNHNKKYKCRFWYRFFMNLLFHGRMIVSE